MFKALEIWDQEYHEKYRKYIREKRFGEYIKKVTDDLQEKIYQKNKKQIEELIKEQFPDPEYIIKK